MSAGQFSADLPSTAEGARAARQYVRMVTGPCARPQDIELAAAELALCALHHTPSGGTITSLRRIPGRRLRIEAMSAHCGWHGNQEAATAYGYGLLILDRLARRFGHYQAPDSPPAIWAELPGPSRHRLFPI